MLRLLWPLGSGWQELVRQRMPGTPVFCIYLEGLHALGASAPFSEFVRG